MSSIISLLFIFISTVGIGLQLQKKLLKHKRTNFQDIFFAYFYGYSISASFIFLSSWFFPAPYNFIMSLILFGVGFFLFFGFILKIKYVIIKKWNLADLTVGLILTTLLSFNFLYSFHKPTEWDEVSYHLPVVKELANGALQFPLLSNSSYNYFYPPFSTFYGSLPYVSESISSFGYILSGKNQSISHLLYFLNFLIFLLLINTFFKDYYKFKQLTGLIISIAFLLHGGILILLGTGLIDITTSIFQLLACLLLFKAQKENKKGYLWLSLLCLGAAFGHKFTTAFILPIYIPWFYLTSQKIIKFPKKILETIFKSIFWLTAGGGIWYIKNFFLYNNPIYPLFLGHKGVSNEEYQFLKFTLIDSLRTPITLGEFFKMLISQYKDEINLVLFLIFVTTGFLFFKIKLRKIDIYLLLSGLSMFFLNYLVGSQLSRYVLLLPMIIYFLAGKILDSSKLLSIIMLLLILSTHAMTLKSKTLWITRANEINKIFTKNAELDSIGCVADLHKFCSEKCGADSLVLNLWDAYASVFYEDTFFYMISSGENFETIKLPKNVQYIYTNQQWKNALQDNESLHSGMQPKNRALFESNIINTSSKLLFSKDNCRLYQIESIQGLYE